MFVLSLCSKRMKHCVIQAKRRVPKIWYCVYPDETRIAVQEEGKRVETILEFFEENPWLSGTKPEKLKIGEDFTALGTFETVRNKLNQICLIRVLKSDRALTRSLYEHVKSLFRYTKPCGLEVHINTFTDKVPIYEKVDKILLTGKSLKLNDLDSFLSQYPNLSTLMIQPSVIGQLCDSSKILEISNIQLSNPGHFGASLLSKFTGRNIDCRDLFITEAEINLLIRKWMKSEAYHNLETIHFSVTPDYDLDTDLIIDQLETEEFDPTKRPQWYQIDYK
ncbi:hypothetical protein GCK72_000529 [Caenorhabditis remanei]|uniref:F-box associated domain-containing protein n=1 Tax=Caenorhabditis remanei TaxID=31234 RepID=A0A6A5HPW8_CAERE|nr:hypothetical protein GCK72_000529 [Caenorhabditis remanei]KAF1768716.1 hypothetical protein GCK72_000529 [Caenorhabditis remanei]